MTVLFSAQAWPHSLSSVGLSVRYQDNEVQLIANVPVDAFINVDGSRILEGKDDGKVSIQVFKARLNSLLNDAKKKILLLDQDSLIADLTKTHLVGLSSDLTELEGYSNHSEADRAGSKKAVSTDLAYIKLIFNYTWPSTPKSIDLRYNLFESAEPIHIQILDQSKKVLTTSDIAIDNNIIRIKSTDTPVLDTTNPQNPAVKVQSIWQTGVWHVLKGADHILFILALVLVVRKLKALLLPLTSFTLCHSITLALIAQGFTHSIPSWCIEVAIAASILLILVYERVAKNVKSLSLITGGLGIIHGMGFAQALTDTLGDLISWANALVKLTVAIELTQLGVACLSLGLICLVNKLAQNQIERYYQACTLLIALMASYWLFERVTLVL